MKTVRFWKVETPFRTRFFDSEQEAYRLYNAEERAAITTFTRRSELKIAAVRERIARDRAEYLRRAEEMKNLDARCEAWLREHQ